MKSKFNKIFGVGLTIALLASLLIVAPAAVSAGNLTYDVVKAPSAVGLVLTSATDVSFVAAAADGKTVFAYDNAAKVLYKSADAGVTFTTTSIGTGLNTNTIVGLVVSPNYATDSIVAAATAGAYFSSSDGGKTFVNVANADLTVKLGSGTITSLDLAPYFATNILNAIVGVTGGTAANSNVLRFAYNSFEWVDVGTAASMTENVTAVKFSPNHLSDASILAVSTTTAPVTHVNIHTGLDTVAWNTPTLQFVIPGAFTATSAVIALGSDYLATGSSQTILVGTTDAAAASDVFRISQSFGQTTGLNATDLNLAGAATSSQIKDIAISGVTASTTLVATVGSAVVARTANPTGTVTWTTTNTKAATGAAASDVLWISGVAYVGTTGADSALSKSADGASWNQLSIIDVQLVSNNITLVGSAVVDANTIFVIINNANGVGVARSLFKTTNGGTSYERILTGATLATVNPSPAYATDSTVFVTDTTALIRKSTDGGTSFTSAAIPAAVTSFYVKDGSTFYAGTSGSFYKGGRFNAATGLQAATAITSIAISGTTI
ncbi:MAG: hypothetical protein HY662_01820, partial [Chloroflexi bacterium]|nr:hypothetical protein [Chloroflexota bacterium]